MLLQAIKKLPKYDHYSGQVIRLEDAIIAIKKFGGDVIDGAAKIEDISEKLKHLQGILAELTEGNNGKK